jgi:tripartite-type tricarboxylate transporter receptor subunit TctC
MLKRRGVVEHLLDAPAHAAGGSADIVARLMGQWLSERLRRQFLVENRPGASTNIATEAVAKAMPDGYTLLMIGSSNIINATLYDKLSYNFIRDIAPVASVASVPLVMQIHPSVFSFLSVLLT